MATKGQLQNFLWAQKLQNLRKEIIQILLSHFPRYFLEGAKTEKLKSVIIHIVQSSYPPSGNVHVILLKFKMATTNQLFKYL